jgi:hypothetical protein
MTHQINAEFSLFESIVSYLYDIDPIANNRIIAMLLRSAGASGFFTQAEALRDRLYPYEAGQLL